MKDISQNRVMIHQVAERFRALGDETRIRLLARLMKGEANVTTLGAELGIAHASISRHLARLRKVGLLAVERRGTNAVYRIRDKGIAKLCDLVCRDVVKHHREVGSALKGRGAARSGGRRQG